MKQKIIANFKLVKKNILNVNIKPNVKVYNKNINIIYTVNYQRKDFAHFILQFKMWGGGVLSP